MMLLFFVFNYTDEEIEFYCDGDEYILNPNWKCAPFYTQ